jgi:integrase
MWCSARMACTIVVARDGLQRSLVRILQVLRVATARDTWTKAQVRKFLRTAGATRLHVAWPLSLYGLRRGEVLGLRWSDIEPKNKT